MDMKQSLAKELKHAKLHGADLDYLTDSAAMINKVGFDALGGWGTRGQPGIDGVIVGGLVSATKVKDLLDKLLKVPHLRGVEVFPYGIKAPDWYRIEADLGAQRFGG